MPKKSHESSVFLKNKNKIKNHKSHQSSGELIKNTSIFFNHESSGELTQNNKNTLHIMRVVVICHKKMTKVASFYEKSRTYYSVNLICKKMLVYIIM